MDTYISKYIWNDDDRDTSEILSRLNKKNEKFISINKILKEMYNENENDKNKSETIYVNNNIYEIQDDNLLLCNDYVENIEYNSSDDENTSEEEEYNDEVLDNLIYNKVYYY